MGLIEKIQKLKIVDGLLVIGFLLVILGIGMNFKDKFTETGKTEIVSNEVEEINKNDVEVNS